MRRSRVILGLRVLLPLVALVLLSTLFLAARKPGPEPVLPYVTDAPEDAARGAGIAGADYAGVTSDGGRLRVIASHAVPQGQDGTARDLVIALTARDGSDARLTAPAGQGGPGRAVGGGAADHLGRLDRDRARGVGRDGHRHRDRGWRGRRRGALW